MLTMDTQTTDTETTLYAQLDALERDYVSILVYLARCEARYLRAVMPGPWAAGANEGDIVLLAARKMASAVEAELNQKRTDLVALRLGAA
jgi:hypothetical protein